MESFKVIVIKKLKEDARRYNKFLHSFSVPENDRCSILSSVLVALKDDSFLKNCILYKDNEELIKELIEACKRVLRCSGLQKEKRDVVISEYLKIKNIASFNSNKYYDRESKKEKKNTLLREFIINIREYVLPYTKSSDFDFLGQFYNEFIRHTGSNQKTGVVLTPMHIAEFFCEIAELKKDDVVFDECCGTAVFLIASINYISNISNNKIEDKKHKEYQFIGIEKRNDMFSHACSNMIIRGNNKSNILHGDCFKKENVDVVKQFRPNKAFLNPPYQNGNSDEQLEFVENALSCIVKGGTCVAICQMSTVVSDRRKLIEVKRRLLKYHTLEGVFSMNDALFHPVDINTVIIIFTAHIPQPKGKKSFFGYFLDDGFVKNKIEGRTDKNGKWEEIKNSWLDAYRNRKVIPGLSVVKEVSAVDEWCAEAYMKTDYSNLCKEDFIKTIKSYVVYKFLEYDEN